MMYRGYELEDQGDGTVAIFSQDGASLITYADSREDAKKVIDEWMVAP